MANRHRGAGDRDDVAVICVDGAVIAITAMTAT
jgi:hypothetical protein